jgi:hypothetical protein
MSNPRAGGKPSAASESKEITVMAHICKAWPESFVMYLVDCGRPIAMGHDPFSATAKRLVEEGHDPDHTLTVRFVDERPAVTGLISDGLLV